VRVLPQRTKSNYTPKRLRKGPHARAYLVWQLLLGSLIFDPIVPLIAPPTIPVDLAISLATLCAIGTLPFLVQSAIHAGLSKLRTLHSKRVDLGSKTVPLSLLFGTGAIILLKLLVFMKLPPVLVVGFLLLAVFGGGKYVAQVRKQSDEDKALFASNPWAKVQRWEHQVFVFAILPLILARAISLCGALALLPPGDESLRLVCLGASALFLGMLQPDRSFFIGVCKRCQRPVPIVFQDIGGCLSCDVRLQMAYHAWIHKLTPSPSEPGDPPSERETGDRAKDPNRR